MATLTLKKNKTLTLKKPEPEIVKTVTLEPKKPKFELTIKDQSIELNNILCEESSIWRNNLPLRIRIEGTLLKRKELKDKYGYAVINATLRTHVWSNRYLNNTVLGGNRFDIDGNPNGVIFEKARVRAVKILKSRGAGVILQR